MDIKGFYQKIGGDYSSALLIMMNDAFIERMLTKFFSKNTYNDIVSSYEKKDFKSLFASVHSFKGVVGNLALTPLFEIANVITEATRSLEEVNIDKEIDELKDRYTSIEKEYLNQVK